MKKILFQGDSITDCGRSRDCDGINLGAGYATVVHAMLGSRYPGEYACVNRAVSGNRSIDVYARIKQDIINVAPDYLSFLMGVNDVWHEYDYQNGVDAVKFERNYRLLLDEVKAALPDCKIIILGAFFTPGPVWEKHGDDFRKEVALRAEAAKRVAADYDLPFIDLMSVFDEACKKAPASYWTREGVHPLNPGHGLIANEWMKVFETIR